MRPDTGQPTAITFTRSHGTGRPDSCLTRHAADGAADFCAPRVKRERSADDVCNKSWAEVNHEKMVINWARCALLKDRHAIIPERPHCPRDFCALYRRELLLRHRLSFSQKRFSAGETMYLDLAERGYTAAMVDVAEMMTYLDHVAHGTAALRPGDRRLRRWRRQYEAQRALRKLLARPHVRALAADTWLDDPE